MPIIYDIAAFFRWLREATPDELKTRAEALEEFYEGTSIPAEIRAECVYYLNQIRSEQLERIVRVKKQ
jgi:hypothetical protein